MKKTILYILIAVNLFFPFSNIKASSEEDYSKYMEFVIRLGIMPKETSGDEGVTRGEFADYLCNILFAGDDDNTQEWLEEVLREDNYDVLMSPPNTAGYFEDVSSNHQYYKEILRVRENLIMRGTGNSIFEPDKKITYNEAAAAMVRILGYNVYIQDNNYMSVAKELDVFRGMKFSDNDFMDKNNTARMFYNCFDVELMKVNITSGGAVYEVDKGVNIYEKYMSVYKDRGQIIKNQYTSIDGDKAAQENTIEINGIEYSIESSLYLQDLIGRDIEFFYKMSDDMEYPVILWGYASNRDDADIISADDFISFKNYEFTYLSEDKTRTKKIRPGASVIYNGMYKTDYAENDFDFENGDITIIKPAKSKEYEIVIVNNYQSYYVSGTDSEAIYAKQSNNGEIKKFSQDQSESYMTQFYRSDGTKTDISEIKKGDIIDVAQNNGYMKFIISNNVIPDFYVTGISRDGDMVQIINDNDERLTISTQYYNSLGNFKPVMREKYTVRLNSFGKIVYIENTSADQGTSIYYIIRSIKSDTSENIGYIKALNKKGVIKIYETEKNAVAFLQDRRKIKIKDEKAFENLANEDYSGIAELEINEDNKITRITLPVVDGTDRDNVLGLMMNKTSAAWCGMLSEKFFEGAMLKENNIIFNIDNEQTLDEDKYRVISTNRLADGSKYDILAYNYNSNSVLADCIVVNSKLKESMDNNGAVMYMIDRIYTGINESDETVTKADVYKISTSGSVEKTELIDEMGMLNNAETFFNDKAKIKLKKGDIIYCEFDDDYVRRAVLVYSIFDELGKVAGELSGTSGVYDPENGPATNPYRLTNEGAVQEGNADALRDSGTRLMSVNAYNLENDKYLTYTTQPIDTGRAYDRKNSNTRYFTETAILPSRYVVAEVSGNKISVRDGRTEDIRTYMSAGSDCSRLFVYTRYGTFRQLVVINEV